MWTHTCETCHLAFYSRKGTAAAYGQAARAPLISGTIRKLRDWATKRGNYGAECDKLLVESQP